MDFKNYNLEDFEQQMREQLNSLHEAPDADLWQRIAEEQVKINRVNSLRKYLLPGAGTLLLLLLVWNLPFENVENVAASNQISSINLTKNLGQNWSNLHLDVLPTAAAATTTDFSKIENLTAREAAFPVFEFEKNAASIEKSEIQKIDFQRVKSIEAQFSPDSEPGVRGFIQNLDLPQIQPLEFFPNMNLPVPAAGDGQPQASVSDDNSLENLAEIFEKTTSNLPAKNASSGFQFEKIEAVALLDLPKQKFELAEKPTPSKVEIAEKDPLTRPVSRRYLRIGLVHNEGKMFASHSQNAATRNAGLMIESHLTKNIWLLTGFEWSYGEYQIPVESLSEAEKEQVFYDFKFHPAAFQSAKSLDTYFDGFSFPIGVSVYKNLKIRKLDGFARAMVRPMLLKNSSSTLDVPSGSPGSLQVDEYGRWVFRPGWAGVQAGVQYRLFGRLRVECAVLAERTMGRLGHENLDYSNLGARLGVKWGG